MIGTWVSILPPLIAIVMVFATKTGAVITWSGNSLRRFLQRRLHLVNHCKNLWECD